MKVSAYFIVFLVLTAVAVNLLLLLNQDLIHSYFKWVNGLTGLVLVLIVSITWLSKKRLDKRKTSYVHKIFSEN